MDNSPNAQTLEVLKSGATGVQRWVAEMREGLTLSYERLRWLGFSAISGVLIIIASFVCSLVPGLSLPIQSQILFALIGFGIFLLSAAVFALQNIHAFQLENRRADFEIRSLELEHQETKSIVDTHTSKEIHKNKEPFVSPKG
jgi:hypothetical protein